jgi:hypothetical protein
VTQKSLFLKNFSGVSVERCLKAVRVPEKSPILSRFLLGSCADHKTLDPVVMPNGSLYRIQVLACQFLMTLRQINLPKWSLIYEMLTSVALRSMQPSVRKIIAHGPPVTGKTRTMALLLALLYHDTPLYDGNSCTLRRPSMRTLVCAASNAGVNELLSRLVKNGVFSLNFASVHGDDEERESPAYF